MSLVYAYKDREVVRDITILDANGDVVTPAANDEVKVSIVRNMGEPELEVSSTGPTEPGSTLTINGSTVRLRIVAGDLQFDPGVYDFIADFMDSNDGDQWKNIERHVFVLENSP